MWEARGWRALRFQQVGSTLGEVEFGWLPSGSEIGCEKLFLLSGQLEIACRPPFSRLGSSYSWCLEHYWLSYLYYFY